MHYIILIPPEKEHCIKTLKDYVNFKIGRNVVKSVCGISPSLSRDARLLLSPVIATKEYIGIIGEAKSRIKGKQPALRVQSYETICAKVPRILKKIVEEEAKDRGTTISDIIRRALTQYFMLSGY